MTLSWLSFIPNTLRHLAFLSGILGNRWKEAPGFWLELLPQLVAYFYYFIIYFIYYVQVYCIILVCTSTDSHSSHTVFIVQVSCLSPWSLKMCSWYSCSHVHVLNCPPANFAIHDDTLHTAKEQSDVTSYIPCILSLACN